MRAEIGAGAGELITPHAPLRWLFTKSRLQIHHLTSRYGLQRRLVKPARIELEDQRRLTRTMADNADRRPPPHRTPSTNRFQPTDNPSQYDYSRPQQLTRQQLVDAGLLSR